MRRVSAWFDRHPKTRIALQLVLDGLPFLLLAFPFMIGIIEVNSPSVKLPYWLDATAIFSMQCIMYGCGAVIYVIGVWLSSRAKREYERYPGCKNLSVILRLLSFVPAVLSLGLSIGFLFYFLKNV